MSKENDLVLGYEEEKVDDNDLLEVIDSSILLINECREWIDEAYDTMGEDKVKVMSMAFKLIHKAQRKLLSQI